MQSGAKHTGKSKSRAKHSGSELQKHVEDKAHISETAQLNRDKCPQGVLMWGEGDTPVTVKANSSNCH